MGAEKSKFLGKRGSVYGPFSETQLSELRASGEIDQYSYLWDDTSRRWLCLEAPPPEITDRTVLSTQLRWEAVGMSRSSPMMISGAIENLRPEGCDLVVGQTTDCPPLSVSEGIRLNVLDPARNVAINVDAEILSVSLQDRSWIFHLHWPVAPGL